MLKGKLGDVLSGLSERERRKCWNCATGWATGIRGPSKRSVKQHNVTRERIRQIEAKALRKIRHPARRSKLEGFLETTQK